jgi:hypothetical protein
MAIRINPKHESIVSRRLKDGDAKSRQQVVDQAMGLLGKYHRRLAKLRKEIDKGIKSIERGEGIVLRNRSEIHEFFESIRREVLARSRKKRRSAA